MKQSFKVSPCHLPIIKRFNSELMSYMPKEDVKKGLRYIVDDKVFVVDPKEIHSLLNMDEKILLLMLEIKNGCPS
jgi:hypothetical protein